MAARIKSLAHFSFFITSYLPLFLLIIAKQLKANFEFLHFGDFTFKAFLLLISKFGMSIFFLLISIYGLIGLVATLKNISKNSDNGMPSEIVEIKNISSESINYIATYIIPFVFQKFDLIDTLSIFVLLSIIYCIYIRSNLLAINPLLSIRYTIFEAKIKDGKNIRSGIIISKNHLLKEGSQILAYEFTYKIFYVKER